MSKYILIKFEDEDLCYTLLEQLRHIRSQLTYFAYFDSIEKIKSHLDKEVSNNGWQ